VDVHRGKDFEGEDEKMFSPAYTHGHILLADSLNDFSRFGERVVSAIQESPESPLWLITESIAIENRHWRELCAQIIS
jgi:hypothetical protein